MPYLKVEAGGTKPVLPPAAFGRTETGVWRLGVGKGGGWAMLYACCFLRKLSDDFVQPFHEQAQFFGRDSADFAA